MKILIADKLHQDAVHALVESGCEVKVAPGLKAEDLPDHISGFDTLVVRSTKVSKKTLLADRRLKLIIRAGAGYDNVDVSTASQEGIYVANCPGKNAIAVAELTMGLILSCDRQIPEQTALLRSGKWDKKRFSKARGLFGLSLGLVGAGSIAREVAKRARSFGLEVIVWSRNITPARAQEMGASAASSLEELAAAADIVSVHLAATQETKGIVGKEFLAAMKPGSFLINTSRGSLVDESALGTAINEKQIRVGADVYANEPASAPADFRWPLSDSEGFAGSHHIGASTNQSQAAIAAEVVRIVTQFRVDGSVLNCVNRANKRNNSCLLRVRHRNKPGVLAQVFQVLSEAHINVEEMENILYEGLEAACARIQLASQPNEAVINKVSTASDHILEIEVNTVSSSQEA